ncbi:MAG TPA: XdhC family protein [Actinomycetota bacterium]|jgi:xanthine/CO dehydrogenase XdhC/CoxF family maturation factor
MSEIVDVLAAIERLQAQGQRMALATIVAVRGSTYRRPGARLLVPETGAPIGNISGGCLENDVADVARVVMEEGQARMVSFDLTADDEAVWGWGLGCNGAIDLFVEPAEKAAETAGMLRMALEEQQPLAMITVLDSGVPGVEWGARLLVRPDGSTGSSLGDAVIDAAAGDAAAELLDAERSEIRILASEDGEVRVFVEVLEPPLRLVVLGAGHDAIPLVAVASTLGWQPIVVDDRPQFLNPDRFPQAASFVALERPDEVAAKAPIDKRTFVVVMTHNFLRDKDYLRSLLTTDARYIAMLGPGARTKRLLDELRQEGVVVADDDLGRIHGPAGLDLGAEGPEEIASAITAEILSVKRGGPGGALRDRPGPIHARPVRATSGRT